MFWSLWLTLCPGLRCHFVGCYQLTVLALTARFFCFLLLVSQVSFILKVFEKRFEQKKLKVRFHIWIAISKAETFGGVSVQFAVLGSITIMAPISVACIWWRNLIVYVFFRRWSLFIETILCWNLKNSRLSSIVAHRNFLNWFELIMLKKEKTTGTKDSREIEFNNKNLNANEPEIWFGNENNKLKWVSNKLASIG